MTRQGLENAQNTCVQLFNAIEDNNLIVAGKSEERLNSEICDLALKEFGIEKHWHKKIVRSGKNTLAIYRDDPPNRMMNEDDILFIDLAPVVAGYEADFGRTYVLGICPEKWQLKSDVEKAWYEIQKWYYTQRTVKASTLFHYSATKAEQYGWEYGGAIAGHVVGKFPHEQPANPRSLELDIHPDNHNDMSLPDTAGNERHGFWNQFIDKRRRSRIF
jgi:Xaa-Pro aminopeptidase